MTKNMPWMLPGCVLVSLFSFDAQALPLPLAFEPSADNITLGAGLLRVGLSPRVWPLRPQWHPICSACGGGAARRSGAALCAACGGAARRSGAALCAACGSSAICVPARLLS